MIQSQKQLFQLPDEVTYLNCAYMSPLLKSVEKAGIEGIQVKRTPFEITKEKFFDIPQLVRKEFAKIIHTSHTHRICLLPSVSYGMGIVARNLKLSSHDEIVVAGEQFPSNVYPWMKLSNSTGARMRVVNSPEDTDQRGKKWNERLLEAVTTHTRLVSVGHIHWADGTLFNLKEIRERTREVGALMVIDGTQSVGALPLHVDEIQPDALICAGYKWLMGPYSTALAYLGPHFDEGEPLEENWKNRLNSEDFTNLVNYQPHYQEGALRYDVGEASNFILLPMLLEALRQINRWTPEGVQTYCKNLVNGPLEELHQQGFRVEHADYRSSHLFGIRVPDSMDLEVLKRQFHDERIYVSVRGNAIRISPHVYNEPIDLKHLIDTCLHVPVR